MAPKTAAAAATMELQWRLGEARVSQSAVGLHCSAWFAAAESSSAGLAAIGALRVCPGSSALFIVAVQCKLEHVAGSLAGELAS